MNAATPLAYMLTWTCFGTRLHGDARGTVDRHHNVYATPVLEEDIARQRLVRSFASIEPIVMTPSMRSVTRDALIEHCAFRALRRFALNVRTNHVHLICEAKDWEPETLLNGFKAHATSQLRKAGLGDLDRSPWTAGGSKKYLWTQEHLAAAMRYVLFEQGRHDEWTVGPERKDQTRSGFPR